MTTIAADATLGLMAADSHWTDEDERGPVRKVYRINGALVGFAGALASVAEARAWMAGKRPKPPASDVSALILSGSRLCAWTPIDGYVDVPKRYAIGTGGKAARAAMLAGASCARAVAIAREVDANTSGRTRIYKLRTR